MPSPKSTRWAFTAYKEQWNLFETMPAIVKQWGWQTETCPTSQREHYQGYLQTQHQITLHALIKTLPGVHIEVAKNWSALQAYCRKKETAIEGSQQQQTSTRDFWSMERAFVEIATHADEYQREQVALLAIHNEPVKFDNKYNRGLYWYGVRRIIAEEPWRVSIFAQPHMEKTFIMTASVYSDPKVRALVLQPEPPRGSVINHV